jgi:hypothetical protein
MLMQLESIAVLFPYVLTITLVFAIAKIENYDHRKGNQDVHLNLLDGVYLAL